MKVLARTIKLLCERLKFTDGCSEELNILCCSFLTLLAINKQQALLCKANCHTLNRKFVWTDDTTQDSEETATAYTVSQSSHNKSRTKLQFANPRIKIQENVARSLLVFVALQPLSSYSWNTHTQSRIHRAAIRITLTGSILEDHLSTTIQTSVSLNCIHNTID